MSYVVNNQDFQQLETMMQRRDEKKQAIIAYNTACAVVIGSIHLLEIFVFCAQWFYYLLPVTMKICCIPLLRKVGS